MLITLKVRCLASDNLQQLYCANLLRCLLIFTRCLEPHALSGTLPPHQRALHIYILLLIHLALDKHVHLLLPNLRLGPPGLFRKILRQRYY